MIKLLHGDCLELMKDIPDGSVDMVLTDPPYGMNYQSGWRKSKHKVIYNDDNLSWLTLFTEEAYRVSKDNTGHYVFCSHHNIELFKSSLSKKFDVKNIIVWVKNNHGSGDLKGDYAPNHEFILYITKGRHILNGKRDRNVIYYNRAKSNIHPTEKPVDLMSFFIKKSSLPNGLVIDPFAGSGSTGIACLNTNRKFIGIEKDDHYFNVAKKRIEEHQLAMQLEVM